MDPIRPVVGPLGARDASVLLLPHEAGGVLEPTQRVGPWFQGLP